MSDHDSLSQKVIDDLLKEQSQFIRKAVKRDRVLLKNELVKKLQECKGTSKIDSIEPIEELLKGIDKVNLIISSESEEFITYSYNLTRTEDEYTYIDSGFITVKL